MQEKKAISLESDLCLKTAARVADISCYNKETIVRTFALAPRPLDKSLLCNVICGTSRFTTKNICRTFKR